MNLPGRSAPGIGGSSQQRREVDIAFFAIFPALGAAAERHLVPQAIERVPITTVPIEFGRYFVSPLIQRLDDGQFAASVSIRSGAGRQACDRVLRFAPRFGSARAARRYATHHGMAWARAGASEPAAAQHPHPQE